jgi:hypothetical protein
MTEGLAVLAGWIQLGLLVALLAFVVLRRSPSGEGGAERDGRGDV